MDKKGILKISAVPSGQIAGIGLDVFIPVPPTVYYNVEQSQIFQKNNCVSGYTGSNVNYIVAANTYSSLISQDDANNKALNDIALNGQNYANTHGTCTFSFDEEFDNWASGLPVGWSNSFAYKPITGTVTNDADRARLDYTGTLNKDMVIAYRNLIPVGVTSIQVIIKVDDITPGGGGCAYTFLEVLVVDNLDLSGFGPHESKASVGGDTQFLKTPGTYTFTFNTLGYRNFVLKYRNVDGTAHIHPPPVTCCIDSVIINIIS
jgi:Family of unknown function (DUF5977)